MTQESKYLAISTELALVPRGNPARRTLEALITPPQPAPGKPRPALNLALVLDRSGSMGREKLAFAKQAALHLLDLLTTPDRAALVIYDDKVEVLAESAAVTDTNRARLKESLQQVRSGGTTALCEGWLTGCRQAAAFTAPDNLTRALLLTDGLANVGVTDLEELSVQARDLYKRGVSTSTFGVGAHYDEHLLEAMANAGGGNYYFIDSPAKIAQIFASEFSELAEVTMRDVELTLRLPEGVKAQVLGAWDVEEVPGQLRVKVGALTGGRVQSLCVDLFFPAALEGSAVSIQCLLLGRGDDGRIFEDSTALTYQVVEPGQVDAAAADETLLARAARLRVADTVNRAHVLERKGQREEAVRLISEALRADGKYLDEQDVRTYERMMEDMLHGRDELLQKASQQVSYVTRKGRIR